MPMIHQQDPPPLTEGSLTIRRAQSIKDYRACQDAQRQAWGVVDDGYLIPLATLVGANLHGGLVLGAFLDDGSAAAMSFAFLGRIEGRQCLYSQLTGVIPAFQGHGLGFTIKTYQAQVARQEGVTRIAWAFDPLQEGNAHFNLGRLRATCGRYLENMYGARTDLLNAAAQTDRLIAEWNLIDPPMPRIAHVAGLPRLIEAGPRFVPPRLAGDRVLIEIPRDIAALRTQSPAEAESWRLAVCQAFQAAFAAGYRSVDFVRLGAGGTRSAFYVLERV